MGLTESVFPGVPIYSTMGETDFDLDWAGITEAAFIDFAATQKWLTQSELETFRKGAYFSHDFGDIRVLFLNSVVYSVERKHPGDSDPLKQFEWMETMAADAVASGLSVGVVLHIPPSMHALDSKTGWHREYVARYENISRQYDFQFVIGGHSHLDRFLPIVKTDNRRHSLEAPSVSPIDGNNPGFRVYTLTGRGMKNYRQYFTDLTNDTEADLMWKLEYDFASAYGVSDGSPANLAKAASYAGEDAVGKQEYRPRLYNQAMQKMRFYHCALTAMTVNEIVSCQKNRAKDMRYQ
jgi:sphingomyelin phosphodiesterase acid-like 3